MNIPLSSYYPPIAAFQPSYTSRLAWAEPRASVDWENLISLAPQTVDKALSRVDAFVRAAAPASVIRAGKTMIRNDSLFIYHTYSGETKDENIIVAGITVERGISHVIIRGDIVGEESGVIYSEIKARTVAGNQGQVLMEVQKAAEELAGFSKVVAKAVANL